MYTIQVADVSRASGLSLMSCRLRLNYHKELGSVIRRRSGPQGTWFMPLADVVARLRQTGGKKLDRDGLEELVVCDVELRAASRDRTLDLGEDVAQRSAAAIATLNPEEMARFNAVRREYTSALVQCLWQRPIFEELDFYRDSLVLAPDVCAFVLLGNTQCPDMRQFAVPHTIANLYDGSPHPFTEAA